MTAKKTTSQFVLLSQDDKMRKVANLYALRFIDWQIHNQLDQLRQQGQWFNGHACLWLAGNHGVGKTILLQKYAERHPVTFNNDRVERPVVYVSAPIRESSAALVGAMFNALEISMPKGSVSDRVNLLQHHLRQQGVQVVLVDEAEYLCSGAPSKIAKEADLLTRIVIATGIPFVFSSLTPPLLSYNSQLARITQQVQVQDFSNCDSESFYEYRRWLHDIDLQIPFDGVLRIADPPFAQEIYAATKGSPALIMKLVQTICFSAIQAGRDIPVDEDITAGFRAVGFNHTEDFRPEAADNVAHQRRHRIVSHPPVKPLVRVERAGIFHKIMRWIKASGRKTA